jgi:hypothetical protein
MLSTFIEARLRSVQSSVECGVLSVVAEPKSVRRVQFAECSVLSVYSVLIMHVLLVNFGMPNAC